MREIHLINPFENAFGGSELRTLSLASLLEGKADLKIWALGHPDPRLKSPVPIVPADISKPRFPKSGTFVFVGAYYPVPMWVSVAKPERAVLVYNVPYAPHLRENIRLLETYEVPKIDVVVASHELEPHVRELGLEPTFEPSWIDFKRFSPPKVRPDRPFTVGRMSRDVLEKFHEEDPALFRSLAETGVKVQLMGATCIADRLGNHENIEVLPAGAMPPEKFLARLDAFVYRTHNVWNEAWGRAVIEALAMGVPTVLDHRIGALQILEPEVSALRFQSSDEGKKQVERLRREPKSAHAIGTAGASAVARTYSPEAKRKIVDFYVKG